MVRRQEERPPRQSPPTAALERLGSRRVRTQAWPNGDHTTGSAWRLLATVRFPAAARLVENELSTASESGVRHRPPLREVLVAEDDTWSAVRTRRDPPALDHAGLVPVFGVFQVLLTWEVRRSSRARTRRPDESGLSLFGRRHRPTLPPIGPGGQGRWSVGHGEAWLASPSGLSGVGAKSCGPCSRHWSQQERSRSVARSRRSAQVLRVADGCQKPCGSASPVRRIAVRRDRRSDRPVPADGEE